MAGRFIKLYEKLLNWEWFRDANTLQLFLYLLLKANYRTSTFQGVKVGRGQLITSISKLGQATGQSDRQIRDNLKHLEMTGEVTSQSTNRYRIITVVRYDDYQSVDKQSDKQNDKQLDKQMTSKMTSQTATSIEYIENIEDIEKDRIIPPISPKGGKIPADDSFSVFWDAYPKKVSKPDALKAWKKLKPDSVLMSRIMDGLSRWKESDQWNRDGGQYIPYPATWLNKQKWEDEISPAPVRKDPAPAPVKTVPAANYEQRDYGDEDELAFQRMIQEWRNG